MESINRKSYFLKSAIAILLALILGFSSTGIHTLAAEQQTKANEKIVIKIQVLNVAKNQGMADPKMYSTKIISGKFLGKDNPGNVGLVFTRQPGEALGVYKVNVSLPNSDKYEIVSIQGNLTIKASAVSH